MNWAAATAFGDLADAPEFVDLYYFLSRQVLVAECCCYCCINCCMFDELMLVR